ncbi:hypothetical protein K2173_025219 [Erythroxylum novogranatense]|uniref:Uncharacterized protein n=1 Tax=Erythroxylum novogranatense TaxID=1862640 RepID=A0AAV8UGV3_9ROSI|nr:hypothetical protein K2173_025219 [Erythroxylum novogranatense]
MASANIDGPAQQPPHLRIYGVRILFPRCGTRACVREIDSLFENRTITGFLLGRKEI